MDIDSSDVLIKEDGDGGPQGDIYIVVLGSSTWVLLETERVVDNKGERQK